MTLSPLITLGIAGDTDRLLDTESIISENFYINALMSNYASDPIANHQTIIIAYPELISYNDLTDEYESWTLETWRFDQTKNRQFTCPNDSNLHPVALTRDDREWRFENYAKWEQDVEGYALETLARQLDNRLKELERQDALEDALDEACQKTPTGRPFY